MYRMGNLMFKETENQQLASGTFRLNGRFFDEDKLKMNMHRLSLEEKVSRPTIVKYLRDRDVDNFSGEVLYAILTSGFGLSPSEIKELRVSDLFDIVPRDGAGK
jgi:hypothetical protein